MNISINKRILPVCAYFGAVVYGLAGFAAPVGAQNATATASSQSDSIAVSTTHGVDSAADE
jgi:hypothetical protein